MWRLFYNIALLVVSPVIVAILMAKRRCRQDSFNESDWKEVRLFLVHLVDRANQTDP